MRKAPGPLHRTASQVPPPPPTTRVLRSQTALLASKIAPSKVTKPQPRRRRIRLDPWTPKRRPNPNPRPRPPPPSHFTCSICVEERPTADFIRYIPPKRGRWSTPLDAPYSCTQHLSRHPRLKNDPVCKSCIGLSMSARLDTLGARSLSQGCLSPGCTEPWAWDFIMRYLPGGAVLEKYNLAMLHVWKEDSNPKPLTCISPSCTAIGLPDTASHGYPQVVCHTCEFRQCAICLVPWHVDETCAERAAVHIDAKMTDPEKETLKLVQEKDGRRCPNCYLVIEKDGGCDSMFCIGCSTYFNWATAASAVPGSRKAAPAVYESRPYWAQWTTGVMPCEMDTIQEMKGGQLPALAWHPLLDEDL